MSKTKKRSVWAWVGAVVAGCGLCCIPLIVPLLGGAVVAGGVSMAFLDGGWVEIVVCTLALAVIAAAVFWLFRRHRKKEIEACTPNTDQGSTERKVNITPLD